MKFGTWYQINCETEDQWRDDFARIADAGFDFVVLWHMLPAVVHRLPADFRQIVTTADETLRALDEAARAGLSAYLGIWHPYSMGRVRRAWRPQWSHGGCPEWPDIFNEQWLSRAWRPYVRAAGALCSSYSACRGVFLDDTFPAVPGALDGYLSYSWADCSRFRRWLAARYGSVANLNMTHKLSPGFPAFAQVDPPRKPLENLPLWADWMEARAEWCEDFVAAARRALDEAGQGGRPLELVLSDHDHHMLCNPLQYGVDYRRLMPHVDRFETYMAPGHTSVSRRDLLGNVRRVVRRGLQIAGGKPFLFHTWFADLVTYQPMDAGVLCEVIETAAEEGASGFEVYTFKVHDWRLPALTVRDTRQRPALREVSLKYNPDLLAAIARKIRQLK